MRIYHRRFQSAILPTAMFAALALSVSLSFALAQTINGQISGTVKDSSGAVVPGVTVSVVNEATRLLRVARSDEGGFYLVTNLPPGGYQVGVERAGFKKALKTGYTLVADGRLTVDFTLEAGEVTETVEVRPAPGETVNTTSGELARVVDGEQVRDLALNGRNFSQLTTLIPGAPLTQFDPIALTTSGTLSQSINGNRENQISTTVDGGFNVGSAPESQKHNVGIDFIQEVKIQTTNFSAEYGRNSGAAISVVTRSGGNQFHGSAFEFFRNDRLDARNFFSPTVRKLRFNDFGYSLGGPVMKNKFFFFAGQEWKRIRRQLDPALRTLPTRVERGGDFSFRLRGPDGIAGTADDGFLKDPNITTGACALAGGTPVRTACFPGNIIPANRITPDGRAIANVYNAMERLAISYSDSPTGNNTVFQMESPFDLRQDILRLDYRFNERHSLFGRYLHDTSSLTDPFTTSALPTKQTNRQPDPHSLLTSHTWLITPALINVVSFNLTRTKLITPPVGEFWKRETYGFTYPELFGGGTYPNSIPNVTITGFAGFDGVAGMEAPVDFRDLNLSDNLTIVRGKHTIKTGFLFLRNRNVSSGRTVGFYAGRVSFNPSGNPITTGNALADALLGAFRTYSEEEGIPKLVQIFSQLEAYVSDNWKIHPRLSLELGVRHQYVIPQYTPANKVAHFNPRLYDPAKAVRVNQDGTIAPGSGNRFNGLIRAGDGAVSEASADVLAVPEGAPRGLWESGHRFGPRLSFAYRPLADSKTAIRGGFGIFYDRPHTTMMLRAAGNPPFTGAAEFENGNLANIAGGRTSPLAPFAVPSIVEGFEISSSMNFSLSVQRELPHGVFAEVAYVGNQGRHLLRQPDINQAPFEALAANAALPANQRASVNALRPYKGFAAIATMYSDSNSNYNALQIYLTKRKGNLTLTSSYTWSKALTDANTNFVAQEELSRSFNYGPAGFDRRHIFVTTYTYRFPFFRKLAGVGGAFLSGWEVSGITRFQSGDSFSITGATSIGTRRADYLGGPIELPGGERGVQRWFNTAAFAPAPNERRGNSGVGIVRGPGLQLWDISMRKKFAITDKANLQFQADLFNAFNRANFLGLSTLATNLDFGAITSAAPGRNAQLALKLVF